MLAQRGRHDIVCKQQAACKAVWRLFKSKSINLMARSLLITMAMAASACGPVDAVREAALGTRQGAVTLDEQGHHALEVGKPKAGLMADMKSRRLLGEIFLRCRADIDRMLVSQPGVDRDHNPGAMTMWMAGAGVEGGQGIGASDEFGCKAAERPVIVNDFHAPGFHLPGLDHKRPTYLFNSRNMRPATCARLADSADRLRNRLLTDVVETVSNMFIPTYPEGFTTICALLV